MKIDIDKLSLKERLELGKQLIIDEAVKSDISTFSLNLIDEKLTSFVEIISERNKK